MTNYNKIEKREDFAYIFKNKKTIVCTSVFVVIIILLSIVYFQIAWNRYHRAASTQARNVANSLASLLNPDDILKLTGSNLDMEKSEYTKTKHALVRLVRSTNPIHYAFIITEQDDNITILLESESHDSSKHSSYDQIYKEANDVLGSHSLKARQYSQNLLQTDGALGSLH